MAIYMLKIRRPLGRLIFNMGIAIPGKTVFLIETAPCMNPFCLVCSLVLNPWKAWRKRDIYMWTTLQTFWIRIEYVLGYNFDVFDILNGYKNESWNRTHTTPRETRHHRMHVPAWGLIRGNGNTEMATRGAKLGLCGKKWNHLWRSL